MRRPASGRSSVSSSAGESTGRAAGINPIGDAVVLGLPSEALHDGAHGVGLVLLDLELELQLTVSFLV